MATMDGQVVPNPAHPADEAHRLRVLARYEILDTPPDDFCDGIASLAAELLQTPIAVVSLVDSDRIWFKARHGLDECQISRDPGLCASAIMQDDVWIVEDAQQDERARAHPLVAGPFGLRFYAGVPLRTRDGHKLGALCVIDLKPRRITGPDITRLKHLAALLMEQMELRLVARDAADEASALARHQEIATGQPTKRPIDDADLKQSDQRFRFWAEMSSDVRWELDDQFRFKTFIGSGMHPLGLKPFGDTPWEYARADRSNPLWAAYIDNLVAGRPFVDLELPMRLPGVEDAVWIRTSGRPVRSADGRISGYVGVSTNITQKKKADRELDRRAGQQQGLALLGQAALQDVALDDLFRCACETLIRTLGVSAAAVLHPAAAGNGLKIAHEIGLGHEDTESDLIPISFDSLAGTAFLSANPVTVIDAEIGESVWRARFGTRRGVHSGMATGIGDVARRFGVVCAYSAEPRHFTKEDTTFLQSVAFVMSAAMERREAVASLRLRDRALEAVGQGIAIADAVAPDAPIVYVNRTLGQTTGFSVSDLMGRPMSVLFGGTHFEADVLTALDAGDSFSGHVTATRQDGSTFPEEVTVTKIVDPDGRTTHYVSTHADITPRQRLESDLRQVQKMDAIGKLTGGVAHDFNNLLTVILGNAEVMAEMTEDPGLRPLADTIVEAAERGADTVQRLLSFGRRQALQPENVDVNAVIRGLANLCHRTIGEEIAMRAKPGREEVITYVDRSQLENAILNLVVNARDAMARGGIIAIEAGHLCLQDDEGPAGLPPGRYVSIEVIDTGCGMSQEVMDAAFEPFFTTKEVGKGTGLGLSMVYGFARQSGGHVRIMSKVGVGTTVQILLPSVERMASSASAGQPIQAGGGCERILVVEDQEDVRSFVSAHLKGLGYKVTAVGDAIAALEQIRNGTPFELLFTDIIMPGGVDGIELAERARKLTPCMKVLFTSGYSDRAIERQREFLDGDVPLLKKPYRRAELARAVRESMDS